MSKLAIVDIDGVLANASARFEKADESGYPTRGPGADNYWQIAFDADLVKNDLPIPGTAELLNKIYAETDYRIIYLTSRPSHLWQVTFNWLEQHGYPLESLICKPQAAKFFKTPEWKAATIAALIENELSGAILDTLLIVESELRILNDIFNYLSMERYLKDSYRLMGATSMFQAWELIQPGDDGEEAGNTEPGDRSATPEGVRLLRIYTETVRPYSY